MQIMLDAPDEELQRRCKQAEEAVESAKSATGAAAAAIPPDSHHNATDQARRLAAYKDLRAQDEVDLEYQVCCFASPRDLPLKGSLQMQAQVMPLEYFVLCSVLSPKQSGNRKLKGES